MRIGYWLLVLLLFLFSFCVRQIAYAATLEDCVGAALVGNPSIRASLQRICAAESMLVQARSAYFPRLYLGANWARSDNPPQAFMMELNQRSLNMQDPNFNPNQPEDTSNTRLTTGFRYRLFSGSSAMNIDMAHFGKEASLEQAAAVRNELIYQVVRGYYSLLHAQSQVLVFGESIRSLEEGLRIANERYNAGAAMKLDVLNLETALAQACEDFIRASNGVQLAIAGLNMSIGSDLIKEDVSQNLDRNLVNSVMLKLDLDLVDNRPEFRAAHYVTLLKRRAYIKTICDYFPNIDGFGSYDWDSARFDNFQRSYTVGLMCEWEIFDGLQKVGAISQAKAEWNAAKLDEEQIGNQLRLDLRQAYLLATEAKDRLSVTQKSLNSAREAWRIAAEQYKLGSIDIVSLLTAEVGLTASSTRDVMAYYDYLIALSNFERSIGSLLQKYKNVHDL